ncbi:MAG: rRNA cytosine-C5-methyltransferase [Bacteroidales bacterium]|nr:rRNA cytosine-C5-methyltransferase [Bacteroidales bacterium]
MNDKFRKYLEEAIGTDNALVAFSAFDSPASVSVRLNPFKKSDPMPGRPVSWCRYGLMLDQRPSFTLDPIFHAGAYYVQDSSSMFVGYVFRKLLEDCRLPQGRPLRVLDLCAAPGGKTTDLAASLRTVCGDDFILVANEVMKARVGVLADNVALWGDPNVVVTSDDPRAFASLGGYFDMILADVPCSGEGMFRKDEQAQLQWSEDNVALCEARQRRIIADVWPSLAENGVLIYSTCTFNRYENDLNVRWISDNLGAELLPNDADEPGVIRTEYGYSLVPGFVEGEGQYCASLRKTSSGDGLVSGRSPKSTGSSKGNQIPDGLDAYFCRKMKFALKGDTVTAVPEELAADVDMLRQYLHVISAGCAVGTLKGKILVPDADMALSIILDDSSFPRYEVDHQTALKYLHRDTIAIPEAPKGYVLICHMGLPLGFVKNLGNRCNSLHPQSRRIRMNI